MKKMLAIGLAMALLISINSPLSAMASGPDLSLIPAQPLASTVVVEQGTFVSQDPAVDPSTVPTLSPDASTTPSLLAGPDETMTGSDMCPDPSTIQTAPPDAADPGHGHHGSGEATTVVRVDGANPYAVAVAASASTFETGTAKSAVIVNPGVPSNAISAASLAGAVGGPVLLTRATLLPTGVLGELRRLGVRRVYIVGSSVSVSKGVVQRLKASGFSVARVWGKSRTATAAAVARKVASVRGAASIDTVFVVSSSSTWDGLIASPYSYSRRIPILYVGPAGMPSATAKTISALRVRKVIVVGSASAVPAATYRKLAALTPRADLRIGGSTRFATARALGDFALSSGWATAAHAVLASGGGSFADAVSAAGVSGKHAGVMLLVTRDALPMASKEFLRNHTAHVSHVAVIGGPGVVGDSVVADIKSALK